MGLASPRPGGIGSPSGPLRLVSSLDAGRVKAGKACRMKRCGVHRARPRKHGPDRPKPPPVARRKATRGPSFAAASVTFAIRPTPPPSATATPATSASCRRHGIFTKRSRRQCSGPFAERQRGRRGADFERRDV